MEDSEAMAGAAQGAAAGAGIFMLLWLAVGLVMLIGCWKVFTKAGQPGWAVLIPIYNIFVMLKVAGKPGWWTILMLIPFVNIVVGIIALVALCARFGKGAGFAVGTIFLPWIFIPILGFGSAQYSAAPAPTQA
jgi:hypothetical protein